MSDEDEVFIDDFAYRDSCDERLALRGWTVRSGTGGGGLTSNRAQRSYRAQIDYVYFAEDPR